MRLSTVTAFFVDVDLLFFKQSLQVRRVRSCRDTYVFNAMCRWLYHVYGVIKRFRISIFFRIKTTNHAKTLKTSRRRMNVDRNIKLYDLNNIHLYSIGTMLNTYDKFTLFQYFGQRPFSRKNMVEQRLCS